MATVKPVIKQCSGCRKQKEIVKHTRGMGYCEGCKGRAPTLEQYNSFLNENIRSHQFETRTRARFGALRADRLE